MSLLNALGSMAGGLIASRASKYVNPMLENLFSQDPAPIEDRGTQAIPAQMQGGATIGLDPYASMPPAQGYDLPQMPTGDMAINLPAVGDPKDDIGILSAQYDLNPEYVQSAMAEGMTIPNLREAAQLSDALYDGQRRLATIKLKKAKGEDTSEDESMLSKIGGGLKNFFGSERGMLSMALAFNTLRNKPDNQLAAGIQDRLKTMSEQETLKLQTNQIVQSLKSQGTPASLKYARMIESNPAMAKEIYKEYLDKAGTRFDKEVVKGESDLRKEFTGLPTVKDFQSQSTAFGRVVASAKDPSAAGDLALIFNYMKVLDPGSTVREGEFATAQNASGIPGRVASLYNNILRGERLNPEQRNDFVDRARRLYISAASSYENIRSDYTDIAKSYEFDVERTVPDLFAQQKDIVDPPKPPYSSLPESVKSTYSAEQFDVLWNGMGYLNKLQLSGS